MAKIIFNESGKRFYETGVSHGVLYVQDATGLYPGGVAWNGLINVTEAPSGAEATPLYASNIKYVQLLSAEEFGATIEAYTYPEEFEECDGSASIGLGATVGQQGRSTFGMSYRTILGNDVQGDNHGYKLHLIYGAVAAPSEKAYQTVNDSPEAITFSWEITTTPIEVPDKKPTASLTLDSTKVDAVKMKAIEDLLYGTTSESAKLPTPAEIIAILKQTPPSPAPSK